MAAMNASSNISSKWKEVLGFGNSPRPLLLQSSLSRSRSVKHHNSTPKFKDQCQISPSPSMTLSPVHSSTPASSAKSSRLKSSSTTTPSSISSQPLKPSLKKTPTPPLNVPTYPRFPQEIAFFHCNDEIIITKSHSLPSVQSKSNAPLFYVSLSADNASHTGRPDITLHAGADKASTAVCFSKIYPSNPVTDMTLCPPPKKSISANFSTDDFASSRNHGNLPHMKSVSLGSFSSYPSNQKIGKPYSRFHTEHLVQVMDEKTSLWKYVFSYAQEMFEWRYSFRQIPGKSNVNHTRLIHVRTGNVVALALIPSYNGQKTPHKAIGMLRFRRAAGMEYLAEEFEILTLVSLMSIMEKKRKEFYLPDLSKPVMDAILDSEEGSCILRNEMSFDKH